MPPVVCDCCARIAPGVWANPPQGCQRTARAALAPTMTVFRVRFLTLLHSATDSASVAFLLQLGHNTWNHTRSRAGSPVEFLYQRLGHLFRTLMSSRQHADAVHH